MCGFYGGFGFRWWLLLEGFFTRSKYTFQLYRFFILPIQCLFFVIEFCVCMSETDRLPDVCTRLRAQDMLPSEDSHPQTLYMGLRRVGSVRYRSRKCRAFLFGVILSVGNSILHEVWVYISFSVHFLY